MPGTNVIVNFGGEYAPAFADTVLPTLTIPTLQRYFQPDVDQIAAQASVGYDGGGLFGLRLDADYVWVYPEAGADYRTLQVGGTVSWDLIRGFGFRVGYDRVWIQQDEELTPTRDLFMPGVHLYTRMADFGLGLGFIKACPETNDCDAELNLIFDMTLPLGRL